MRNRNPPCVFLCFLLSMACLVHAQVLPERLSDEAFWKLVEDSSEDGQQFPGENFVSNELRYPAVVRSLKQNVSPGGAYIGVGPEQNFTYIAAIRPRVAFIVDIRRQNMLQHLMYKALFEMADGRADFLSRLFSRPRPAGLDTTSTVKAMMDAYAAVPRSPQAYAENLEGIRTVLVKTRGFRLTTTDDAVIEKIFKTFAESGPQTNYNSGTNVSTPYLAYSTLMAATDSDGNSWSYLETEESYRAVRDLQLRNLIVPVVGDFGGPKAIRSIGSYLKSQGTAVRVFYVSNVESYLFAGSGPGAPTAAVRSLAPNGGWRAFFENVSMLPLDRESTFIRFRGAAGEGSLATIQNNLDGVMSGIIQTFPDLFKD